MRRVATATFFVVVSLASLAFSAHLHLDTSLGRETGRRALEQLVSAEIAGSVEVREVVMLSATEAELRHVTIRDAEGRAVIVGERVRVRFDPWALTRSEVRFPLGEVEGGELVLHETEGGLPSFVDAFGAASPSPAGTPGTVLAIVERLDVRDLRIHGTLLGVEGLVVEDVDARLALRIDDRVADGFLLRVDAATGRIAAPFGRPLTLTQTSARVRDDASGTRLHARFRTDEGEVLGVLLDYGRPEGADPEILDLLLRLEPVHTRTLAESGLASWAEPLFGEARGHVRLRGPLEDLALRGWVRTGGGEVAIEGRLRSDEASEVILRSAGLRVDRVVDGAPGAEVRGRLRFMLPVDDDPEVEAVLEPFMLGELAVPATELRGVLGEDGLEVAPLRVSMPGGALEARGRVGFDGSVTLSIDGDVGRLESEPTLRDLMPGLRGAGSLHADLRVGSDGTLETSGRWMITGLRYGPVTVGVLEASGRVRGRVDAPEVMLRLQLRDVRVSERRLGDGTGRVEGGPSVFRVEADTREGARRVGLTGRVAVDHGTRVDLSRLELSEGRLRWTGIVDGLVDRGASLSVERVLLTSGDQRVEASGRWRRGRGDDALAISARELDLGSLRALLRAYVGDLPDIDGRLSGSASVSGDLERQPSFRVDASLADGRIGAVSGIDGSVLMQYADGAIVADLGVTARGAGDLELDMRGALSRDQRFFDALPQAALRAEAKGRDLDLALLERLPLGLPAMRGRATGSGYAEGLLDTFDFEFEVDVPALQVALPESWRAESEPELSPPLGFRGRVGYADGALSTRSSLRDDGGQLVEAEASVLLDLQTTVEDPSLIPQLLEVAPWRLALRFPPRRLDRWPLFLRRDLPFAERLLGSATLTLRGGAYQPVGDLSANLAWLGGLDGDCGAPSRPRVDLRAHLEDGETRVDATGLVDDRRVLFAEARGATPVRTWLRAPESIVLPTTHATVWAVDVPLERLPFVCREAEGPLTASIELERLFGARPSLVAEVSSDALRLRRTSPDGRPLDRSPPARARAYAQLGNGRAHSEASVAWWNGGTTRATVGTALAWGRDQALPALTDDARLDGSIALVDAPLEAALFWLPQIAEAHGGLHGEVDMRGTPIAPWLEGELELRDGRLALPALGQRLDDVEGVLVLEGRSIVLQRFEARDGDGVANIAGDITLEGFSPRRADLALDARSFPVRDEGSVLARLTGRAQLGADLYASGLEGRVVVDDLAVRLSEDAGRSPQPLAPHPDVVVLGRDEDRAPPEEPYAVSLAIDARRPFSIKGEDFAAELVATLALGYVDALQLKGEVELRSGHFDIFGKRFEVERGALLFDGETDLDPSVNLVAVHELRSRAGETITVLASGTLSEPIIRFTSSLTNDRAETIALLVSGDVRGDAARDVERAPTDFLAGVAAGVLTLSLREEFGQVVPTIVVEGNSYGGTRVRGGWRLEEVLPESLRRVIRGIYIEGFFNTSGQDGEGARRTVGQVQDFGFLLELALPRDVVNTNTFTPPNNFSLDVTWQP